MAPRLTRKKTSSPSIKFLSDAGVDCWLCWAPQLDIAVQLSHSGRDADSARACARYGVLVVGEEMKGLVNCNFLPGSARRLELGTVSAEPLSRAYWSQNSGRSAKRLACRARVLLAKVPIALKRAVGLSGPSSSRQSAPILQQWSEQVCRSFEAGQAMSHSDANCAKPRTGFRSRPADPWK